MISSQKYMVIHQNMDAAIWSYKIYKVFSKLFRRFFLIPNKPALLIFCFAALHLNKLGKSAFMIYLKMKEENVILH